MLVSRGWQRLRPSHGEVMERYARSPRRSTTRHATVPLTFFLGSRGGARRGVIRRTSGGKNENRGGRRKRVAVLEWRHFFSGICHCVELVQAGGWMMLPIILSSIAATAIVAERLWTLRRAASRRPSCSARCEADQGQATERPEAQGPARQLAAERSSPPAWPTPSTVARS